MGFLVRRKSQVPPGNDWLSPRECAFLTDARSSKRIEEWRLGRFTAKQAVGAFLEARRGSRPSLIEILAADDGAPQAFAAGRPLAVSLSLSHSAGRALCVVGEAQDLGCDIESVEPRSDEFVETFFTPREIALLHGDVAGRLGRDLVTNLIWSAKESALKALRCGLRADTWSVEVGGLEGSSLVGWQPLEVRSAARVLRGWWRRMDEVVATVVGTAPPLELEDLDAVAARCRPLFGRAASRSLRP